ncbi:hypothetical protein [Mucilaginibacter sp. UYCu711]|uniref:hypothetical protein n=1 Tax=Mucilaginibacter sp. UYCu711 TaxID=3156339 RepID=UPI003D1DFA0E
MSTLTNNTDRRAIQLLANTLRFFEGTANLGMTAIDANEAREAENLIKRIIESNGFKARYEKGQRTILTTIKNHTL